LKQNRLIARIKIASRGDVVLEQWGAWIVGAPGIVAAFLAAQLALILLVAPLWIWIVDRWRWSRLRAALIDAALDAHAASAFAAVQVSRELFRENGASPLERLSRVRRAIDVQAEAAGRFQRKCAMLGHAVNAAAASPMLATADFCDATATAMRDVVALYLREAVVRVGSNVAYGDDQLGFAPGQVVSMRYLDELARIADAFSERARDNRVALHAMGRRVRRGARRERLDSATEHAETLAADIRRFGQRLHPADPDSPEYRGRWRGEMAARTLDGLIARFNRGGMLKPLQLV
jgi:hypothetical protein